MTKRGATPPRIRHPREGGDPGRAFKDPGLNAFGPISQLKPAKVRTRSTVIWEEISAAVAKPFRRRLTSVLLLRHPGEGRDPGQPHWQAFIAKQATHRARSPRSGMMRHGPLIVVPRRRGPRTKCLGRIAQLKLPSCSSSRRRPGPRPTHANERLNVLDLQSHSEPSGARWMTRNLSHAIGIEALGPPNACERTRASNASASLFSIEPHAGAEAPCFMSVLHEGSRPTAKLSSLAAIPACERTQAQVVLASRRYTPPRVVGSSASHARVARPSPPHVLHRTAREID